MTPKYKYTITVSDKEIDIFKKEMLSGVGCDLRVFNFKRERFTHNRIYKMYLFEQDVLLMKLKSSCHPRFTKTGKTKYYD